VDENLSGDELGNEDERRGLSHSRNRTIPVLSMMKTLYIGNYSQVPVRLRKVMRSL
jgi:hypothetical protein